MKNYKLASIFFCSLVAITAISGSAYSQDRPPSSSSEREGDKTPCTQSPSAVKEYVSNHVDKASKN